MPSRYWVVATSARLGHLHWQFFLVTALTLIAVEGFEQSTNVEHHVKTAGVLQPQRLDA
jgi:hypothetical protein